MAIMKILVLHGVNLNMFGKRDKAVYGSHTLAEIDAALLDLARNLDCDLDILQTNDECVFIARIHQARDEDLAGVLINAGAWSHYSHAIADALAILSVPIVEIHMSNIYAREKFRSHSVISPLAKGVISGFGINSYLLGLRALHACLAV